MKRLSAYFELTKPKTVWLLVLVGACAPFLMVSENKLFSLEFLTGIIALTLSVAGTNAFTCWIDRDIDAIMQRTRERPLVKGEISPRAAVLFSLTTFLSGVIIALFHEPESAIYLILGFIFSAVLYNGYLKRRSTLNIIFASPAGMMPILFMWSYMGENISLLPVLMGLLVVFWTPAHIWSLAIFYKEDYKRAGVPMLPVIESEEKTIRFIVAANVCLIISTVGLVIFGKFSALFFIASTMLNAFLLYLTIVAGIDPKRENVYRLFKFSSPYLAIIFLIAVIDKVLN